ncbi:MAG: polysaccharide pyruvyl transferase family protein [Clostridia bacterium]|nr:polysaccharide pyruvyl transferase family protein [Clostridia bacterium]
MKVGILTFPGSPSHGAALQMFALYQTLREKGIDVDVINYIPPQVNHRRVSPKSLKSRLVFLVAKLFVKSSKPSFKEFEAQLNKFPSVPIETTEQMQELAARYDRIIVGSDQVWNPVVTGNDMNYYLAFSQNAAQKASYAPSFGVANVADADKEQIASLLSDFTYLCAREERGAEIIKELTGRSVPVVIDPTMLVSRDEWLKQPKKVKLPKGKYVLLYTIKPSPALKRFAKAFADRHGLRLVTIGGRLREFITKKDVYPVSGIGPAEFLYLANGAEYVITNSFHGSAFSIILEKNFYVEYSSDTNSRLTNIVKTFGLESCVVTDETLNLPPVTVDYEKVKPILQEKQREALTYLNGVISESL